MDLENLLICGIIKYDFYKEDEDFFLRFYINSVVEDDKTFFKVKMTKQQAETLFKTIFIDSDTALSNFYDNCIGDKDKFVDNMVDEIERIFMFTCFYSKFSKIDVYDEYYYILNSKQHDLLVTRRNEKSKYFLYDGTTKNVNNFESKKELFDYLITKYKVNSIFLNTYLESFTFKDILDSVNLSTIHHFLGNDIIFGRDIFNFVF